MKTFTRWLLALLLVAMPMMAAVQSASANSELVPASRLVAPYVTNGTSTAEPIAGQSTFLLLTNVSWSGGNTAAAIAHIEFYDKSCDKTDRTVQLSQGDTDQFNIDSTITMTNGHGWADIDVRSGNGQSGDDSIQRNSLVGSVLVADTVDDYAFSYPMAASVGSARTGVTGSIVAHNASGNALTWTGRYEPFPTRLILPAYFAEGTDALSRTVTGFLAIASPSDGNWYGQGSITPTTGNTINNSTCTTATGCGEAPGETLTTTPATALITSTAQIWDGCEDTQSQSLSGHYVSGTLSGSTVTGTFTAPGLFGSNLNRSAWNAQPATGCTTAGGSFPRKDEGGNAAAAGGVVGWIDIPNTNTAKRGLAVTGTARVRGMVGLFFETSVGSAGKAGDASRLWGDRASITAQTGCSTSSGNPLLWAPQTAVGAGQCTYNIGDSLGIAATQP